MSTKVKELDNTHQGDRSACPLCSPKKDRISEDRLWHWALNQPGPVQPLR